MSKRVTPKMFPVSFFLYLTEKNAGYAKNQGKKLFGSVSVYINALISEDRGVKPTLGRWKTAAVTKKRKAK